MNKRSIAITSIGTFLEWYEFGVFGYLATYLAVDFLPKENQLLSMIYVFGIFGLAYVTRPLGGIIFGIIGDRSGRKKAIVLSSLLIALAMLFTACLPTYTQAGATATIMLICSRLIQGLSVGGEYSGTLVSLVEQANESKKNCRGIIGAIGAVTANIGFFSSAFLVSALCIILNKQQMLHWGWRIPFFLGFVIGIIFFLLRTTIDESQIFSNLQKNNKIEQHPFTHLFKFFRKKTVLSFILNICIAFLYSAVFVFLPEISKLENSSETTELIINISLILFSILLLLSGFISDKYGRKFTISISCILILFATSIFALLPNNYIILIITVLAVLLAFPVNSVNVITAELFPTQCRFSGLGLTFNLANVVGGFTPMILMILYKYFKNISFVILAVSIVCIILLAVVHFFVPETAYKKLN